jgi:hypothetical protein
MSERPKGIAEGDVVSLREELLVQLWIAVQDGIQCAVTLCDGSGRDSPKPQKAERRFPVVAGKRRSWRTKLCSGMRPYEESACGEVYKGVERGIRDNKPTVRT